MSLAAPFALAWAALTVPLVIFYILKIRMRQVPVSTTIFWRQIFDDKRPRSLWQQLRHWLSLLVQIVWLLLLVLALAEPYFSWEILQKKRVILVIDSSASMNATDVAPSRLEAAKSAARQIVSRLRFRDEMAVIAAGSQPQVMCGLTGHERTLISAIDAVPRTDGPTKIAEGVELARRLLADVPRGQIVVLSDGGFEQSGKLASDPQVKLQTFGNAKTANVGITNFQVRRSLVDPVGYEILVEVANFSDQPAECRLDIDLTDRPVDVIPLKLTAGQIWSQTLEKTSPEGGRLIARLNSSDALAEDNEAQAILPHRQMQKVVLVTAGNLFLQKALEANPLVELTVVKELPAKFDPAAVYVLHRQVPQRLPAARLLVVDPASGCDRWQLGEKLENPIVTKQDADSPLMRHVRLDNVLLPEARKLVPTEGAQVLVGAVSGDPLYFALEQDGRKALVLTVNLDEGDLTFRTAFPIMVTNSLAWFAGQAAELRESLATGSVSEIELPQLAKTARLVLRAPGGKERQLPAAAKASIGPLDEVGIWSVVAARETSEHEVKNAEQPPLVELACNLASRAESDLRVPEALSQSKTAEIAATSWFVRPIWFYLVGLAWVVAGGEWFLYQRRWIA
ncbi:MAG TPA: VWA domain-containing protein [Pirellulaceae bacterium]|nr:VWA domain-containing protein [Pirellulaceae bacterium]